MANDQEAVSTLIEIRKELENCVQYCFPYCELNEEEHDWLMKNSFKLISKNDIIVLKKYNSICSKIVNHRKCLMAICFSRPTIQSEYVVFIM
jgi:hypothetical protein